MATDYLDPRDKTTATIANAASISGAMDMGGSVPVGLMMPAAFTGTAITFQGSVDNTTFNPVTDDTGAAISVTVAASKAVGLSAAAINALLAFRYIKLVSGATEAAQRSIVVVSRSL